MITLRVVLAVLLCLLAQASRAQADEVERLRIHGSNTMAAKLVPAVVEAWLRDIGYEDIRRHSKGPAMQELRAQRDGLPLVVEIAGRGSSAGIDALVAGDAELAMMVRAPDAREIDAAWQLGDLRSPGQEFVLAVDGIAVVVHGSNPVRHLRVDQLRAVYSGRVTNWRQLGGPDRPIRALLGTPRTAASEFFVEAVLDGAAPAPRIHTSSQVAADVTRDASAIGVIPLRSRVPRGVRPLAVSDGGVAVFPTRVDILSEDYPLLRRYSLHGGQMMSALGRSLALYSTTRRAQEAVERAGHFAVMLRPAPAMPVIDASDAYRRLVAGGERLPLSLRFNHDASGSLFESRAEQDLERLVALMRSPQYRDREVVVIAFGHRDGAGDLVPTMISNDRADIVTGYLQARGIRVRAARGFGTERPLVGPGHRSARFRNERVEIWVV